MKSYRSAGYHQQRKILIRQPFGASILSEPSNNGGQVENPGILSGALSQVFLDFRSQKS
jgi:hypothetical protein